MTKKKIRKNFTNNQKPVWGHIYSREIDILSEEFSRFPMQKNSTNLHNRALFFIIIAAKKRREKIKETEDAHGKFLNSYPAGKKAIRNYLKNYFRQLDKVRGKKICFPFSKYRWLDKKALEEKYLTSISSVKKEISALFNLAPTFLKNIQKEIPDKILLSELIKVLTECFKAESIWQLKQSALFFLKQILSDYKQQLNNKVIEDLILYIFKVASNKNENCWIRGEAAEILSILSEKQFFELTKDAISEQTKNSIFLKRRLIKILANSTASNPRFIQFLNILISDESEFVRQGFAENLPIMPREHSSGFFNILISDEKTSVICQAVKSSFIILLKDSDNTEIFETLIKKLSSEKNKESILFLLNSLSVYFKELNKKNRNEFLIKLKTVVPILEKLRQESEHLEIRRISTLALEQFWCEYNEQAFELRNYILQKLETKKTGKYIKLDKKNLSKYNDETIGRVLSVISQEDFSIQFIKSFSTIKLVKDAFYKFRLWRIFFEFKNPSPYKRQTLKNSHGRHFFGRIRSVSSVMAEKSETGIPGEPILLKEGECRPYLPLPDDILSSSETSSDYKIFSPEGITKIRPPRNILKRVAAEIKTTFNFEKLAEKRNIDTAGKTDLQVKDYISTLRRTGYEISISPYKKDEIFTPKLDSTVNRFFSFPIIPPFLTLEIFEDMKTYFFSLYLNTISQLFFFTCAFLSLFILKHFAINLLFKKARKTIPLVIGGWGTRGKSSTERLKAALFSSLGCNILSKTTGSEASFLHSSSFNKLHEYQIFRPYEKITIWEQYKLIRMASALNIDIFLWECMAITPHYVKIMQRNWMKDNISTITNTYPDHEDIQGPAGWNIAETMTNFIPAKATLITTEDQMYPFLKNSAEKLNTQFFRVTPTDVMLIPEEIINRFPYSEHPNNIALAAALAEKLGIEKEYALKEMCDNVIPDIGVLKKFQLLKINTKILEFLSGMSANEKYACLQNWNRMKMDSLDVEKDYGTIISTVVNNRADRVSRSKVFAMIIAENLSADYHFLVGTNLEGLLGYIKNAWTSILKKLAITEKEELLELFEQKTAFLRIPKTKTILENKLKLMTNNSEIKLLETSEFYRKMLQTYNEYTNFKNDLISNSLPINKLTGECKKLLSHWFYDKLIVLHNPKIRGEEIIKHVEAKTPPYHKNIIMGIQNIKGPGINLINTWEKLEHSIPDVQQCSSSSLRKQEVSRWISIAKTLIEPLSSISKQHKAKSIYNAIASGAISSSKAIEELQKLKS